MPFNITTSTSSSVYASANLSSSKNGQKTHESSHRYARTSHTERDGTTTVRTIRQDQDEPVIVEEHRYDENGRELAALPDARSEGMSRRIEDVKEDEVDVKE
ncbi:hypothetical protein BJY04DRAFT_189678 [Aspergillus karnatakaensis]|uniref:uncharacterized protein n=1 Tax=Aspergillus karnatakaensis TaxID=1810916 RepID=UPI003CCDDB80